MTSKLNNKNGVKLLAAMAVFVMAIAGFAVATADGSDATAEKPNTDPFDGMYTAGTASYDSNTGIFTVTNDTTITLTGNVGSSGTPNNMQIKIANGKTLTFTSTSVYTVYIAFTTTDYSKAQEGAICATDSTSYGNLVVSGKAVLDVGIDASSANPANGHVLRAISLTTNDEAKVILRNLNSTGGMAFTSYKDNTGAALTMNDSSSIELNAAGGFDNVTATLNGSSKIDVKSPVVSCLTFKTLALGTDASITVYSPDATNKGMVYLKNGSTINGTITSTAGLLRLDSSSTITLGDSASINVKEITIYKPTVATSESLTTTINGGNVSGKLIATKTSGAADIRATEFILNNTNAANSLTVDAKVTIEGTVTVPSGKNITFNADSIIGNDAGLTVKVGNNSALLKGLKAAATSTITNGSVGITGDFDTLTGADGSTIYVITGEATLTESLNLGTNVSLIVPEGTKLNLDGKTLTIESSASMVIQGTIGTTGTISNSGEIALGDNAVLNSQSLDGTIVSTASVLGGNFGMKDELKSDYTVHDGAFLAGALTVPAGITLTIASDGYLELNKNKLYVLGTLVVENGGEIRGTYDGSDTALSSEGIYLGKDGKIENEGMIGTSKQVIVGISIDGNEQTGTAAMMNVSGLNFGMKKSVSGSTVSYTLTVSGDLIKDGEKDAKLTLTSVIIDDDLTIGEDVSVTTATKVTVKGGSTLTVDGTLVAGSSIVTMENKSTIIVNGYVYGTIVAQTGLYNTSNGYSSVAAESNKTTIAFPQLTSSTPSASEGVTSIVMTIGTYSYTDTWTDPSNPVAKTSQRLYISGNLDYVFTHTTEPTVVAAKLTLGISGNDVYVASGETLNLKAGMALDDTADTTGIIVDGTIVSALNTTNTVPIFKGTAFKVKTEATATVAAFTTYYIKPFDVAIAEIDSADKKSLVVKDVTVTIDSELNLIEGQSINFDSASDVTITTTGKVTVNAKAKIEGTIDNVDGSLVKKTGGSCTVPTNYAAYVKGTDYEQWAGFQVAIDSAGEGETVTINKAVTISSGDITIPAGKTVIASENITVQKGSVSVAGKLILKDGAKLDIIEAKKVLNVTGEVDASDGIVDLSTTGKINSSAGKTTLASGQSTITLASDINGTVYVDEDNNTVITTAQGAIDAAASQDYNKAVTFYGTVTAENIDIKVNATVDSGAVLSVSNATIADKVIVTLNGKTTGTFTTQTGVASATTGALSDSSISFDEAKGVTIGSATLTDSMNVKTKIFFIYGSLVGTATVTEGTISVGKDTSTNKTLTVNGAVFTIGEKATLDIRTGTTLAVGVKTVGTVIKAAVVIDGTVIVSGTLQDNGTKGIIDVNGKLQIEDEVATTFLGDLNISGEIVISTTEDKEASLTTNGVVFVFDGASISGNVTIGNDTRYYIVAFTGADMEKALLNIDPATGKSTAISTIFYINNDAYMTAYAKAAVVAKTIIDAVDFSVEGLNLDDIKTVNDGDVMNWFSKEDCKSGQISTTTTLNANTPALYYKAEKAEVTGTISTGIGLQIYLNGVSVDNFLTIGGYSVPVGTYKVTIESEYGYDKSTATILFNGTTVTNGETITFTENGFVLTANGATPSVTPAPEPTPIQPSEKDNSMGITEYLLIVLVILAAILVVVVAIRMMRS